MPPVFVITTKEQNFSEALTSYLASLLGQDPVRIHWPGTNAENATTEAQVMHGYRRIVDEIEDWVGRSNCATALRNALAFVEVVDSNLSRIRYLDPLDRDHNLRAWTVVLSMLVLSYPEVQWVFMSDAADNESALLKRIHTFSTEDFAALDATLAFGGHGFTPLFDASKLRNSIRHRIRRRNENESDPAPHIPYRQHLAAAIDDEEEYAYFNAYCAYRFGFRSHVVSSQQMMEDLFKHVTDEDDAPNGGSEIVRLVFEDIYLNFPDKRQGQHFSALRERDEFKNFPGLQSLKYRIFVTKGPEKPDDPQAADNEAYLRSLQEQAIWTKILYKPLSGIFDLWERAELEERVTLDRTFRWPPSPQNPAEQRCGQHGVPGRLLVIAECLIARAEAILKTKTSVKDCIHGATLALEAAELLGNRTPTTAIQAVSLKHELEVSAECMFYGLHSSLDIDARLKDIQEEVEWLSTHFYHKTRRVSQLETEINIVSRLISTLKDNDRLEEEQACIRQLQKRRRQLWFERSRQGSMSRYLYPLCKFWQGVRWYTENLVGSLAKISIAIAFWMVFATAVFYVDIWYADTFPKKPLLHAFYDAVTNFISAHPPHEFHVLKASGEHHTKAAFVFIPFFLMLGFMHLGIFIAYLYSIIARK
ncbi:MAG TPA: hypothetical protein VI636_15030 [Candidatus Angelobacter sp.]